MNNSNIKKKSALLVIDMQRGVVANAYRLNEVVTNISKLVAKARSESIPVIWVQHSDENLVINTDNWQLVKELKRNESESLINKLYGDAFEDTQLELLLKKLGVERVVVSGAQTEACIRATIHGAFVRGYETVLVSDAHTTEDLTEYGLPAPEKIIEFTNIYWTWQSAPNRRGEVLGTADIQF